MKQRSIHAGMDRRRHAFVLARSWKCLENPGVGRSDPNRTAREIQPLATFKPRVEVRDEQQQTAVLAAGNAADSDAC